MYILMKKIVVLFFIFSACHQKITNNDISKLNGYWEIEKVILSDGTKKEYAYNESFDFFKVTDNKGFRKKVMPQLDGRFLVNNQFEKIEITFENEIAYINYSTPYSKWKEEIKSLSSDKLVVINASKAEYYYKKTAPVNILEDGKTTK
jgi:hypothetical protein